MGSYVGRLRPVPCQPHQLRDAYRRAHSVYPALNDVSEELRSDMRSDQWPTPFIKEPSTEQRHEEGSGRQAVGHDLGSDRCLGSDVPYCGGPIVSGDVVNGELGTGSHGAATSPIIQ